MRRRQAIVRAHWTRSGADLLEGIVRVGVLVPRTINRHEGLPSVDLSQHEWRGILPRAMDAGAVESAAPRPAQRRRASDFGLRLEGAKIDGRDPAKTSQRSATRDRQSG